MDAMGEEPADAVAIEIEADEKSATTLELFFDLVFVFAITQVVSLLANDLTWNGLFHATILLGILWWGWTNWTLVTNMVSLGPRSRRIVLLAGMVSTFIMAYAVPEAFEGDGLWVAVPYIVTTILGTGYMFMDREMFATNMSGLLRYTPLNFLGAVLLIVGTNFGDAQQWFWLGALTVNVLAAELGESQVWAVDAKHFAERHGLIMIIALGEAIIAVGASLDAPSSWELAGYLMTGIGFAIILYWAYFDRAQDIWEDGLRKASPSETGTYAPRRLHAHALSDDPRDRVFRRRSRGGVHPPPRTVRAIRTGAICHRSGVVLARPVGSRLPGQPRRSL